jgi:hypothetical protein
MLRAFLKWAALFFLVIESLGLIASFLDVYLKIAHWNEAFSRTSWGETVLELTLRLAIVGLILSTYLQLIKIQHLPLIISRQSALLTTRAVQTALLAAIALYALTAERLTGNINREPFLFAWSVSAYALGTVITSLFLRRRFLFSANEELRRDPHNEKGLSRWRMATISSMVLAMSIGLYGFMLRVMGYARTVEWPFFFVSVALLLLWRPHLDDGTSSPPSPPNPFSNPADAKS